MEVSCPQCGNPNLDVDAQNNVVYCRKCGFAVQVDPQTGNVVPLAPGGAAGPVGAAQAGQAPAAYAGKPREILGTEPTTLLMLGTAVLLLLTFLYRWDLSFAAVLEVILILFYWKFR